MPMDSHGSAAPPAAGLSDVGKRARRRIAYRLLPFVFLMYVVNYIDRVNVSFANLRMSADLGLSDRAYGLGVGMFYLTYVLFEIPGCRLSMMSCWRKSAFSAMSSDLLLPRSAMVPSSNEVLSGLVQRTKRVWSLSRRRRISRLREERTAFTERVSPSR